MTACELAIGLLTLEVGVIAGTLGVGAVVVASNRLLTDSVRDTDGGQR